MHDDFGASLSRIKFLSEKMQLQNDSQHVIKNELEKISGYGDNTAAASVVVSFCVLLKISTSLRAMLALMGEPPL